jgi:hypothetical protein
VGIIAELGIINVVVAPEAEWNPGGVQLIPPQFAVQSTPKLAGSPATVAATVTKPEAGALAGGACVIVIPVTVDITVTLAVEYLL